MIVISLLDGIVDDVEQDFAESVTQQTDDGTEQTENMASLSLDYSNSDEASRLKGQESVGMGEEDADVSTQCMILTPTRACGQPSRKHRQQKPKGERPLI